MAGRQPEWKIETGYGIDMDGRAVRMEGTAATLRFYRAKAGDELRLLNHEFEYRVVIYRRGPHLKYIYTYDYESEQNWTICEGDLSAGGFTADDTFFQEDVFFRIVLRGRHIDEGQGLDLKRILCFEQKDVRGESLPEECAEDLFEKCYGTEIRETVHAVREHPAAPLNFFLLADSHYAVGGIWEDTIRTISKVNGDIRADGCIHLGDLTDGMVSEELTKEYVHALQRDMEDLGIPLYYTVGNHDYNYFRNNPDRLDRQKVYELYLASAEKQKECDRQSLWYYKDIEEHYLRLIFLDSFDPTESVRYGFPDDELDWLESVLGEVSEDWYVVIFSHVPPVPRLHYWSDEIRGSQRLTAIMRGFQRRSGYRLMGFIHGHNHADQIDLREGFPVISIGCAKCEFFTDKKPEGAVTYARVPGTVSQELWDVLSISTETEELRFTRFGAGTDRRVGCGRQYGSVHWDADDIGKAESTRRDTDSSGKTKFQNTNICGEAELPMKKVITYGTFDLFHEGHYNLLKRAKALGDYLIVGVTTEHYDELRGKINTMDPLLERIENVKKSGFADEIIIEDHEGQKLEDIQKYQVDIFTLGSDWRGMFDYLKPYCEVIYLERTPGISSTSLRTSRYPIVRTGIVGSGRIAPRFLAEAKFVSGQNVQCVYNPHKESVSQFAEKHALDGYCGEFEEFLEAVDAIYIATPHETHYDYAKRALLGGKHVLCEKPLTMTVKQAKELYALAREKNLVLMEGIKTAYCPGFTQIVNIARSGKIGDICDVEACFSRLTAPNLREMVDSEYGGAFLEFGSYTLLPILKLLGLDYKKVEFDVIEAENGVDLYSKIRFRYANAMAVSKTGIGVKSEGQLVIAGTKGYILAESPWWLTRKFQVRYEDPTKIEEYTPNFVGDGLRYEIGEFVSRIHGRNTHMIKMSEEESIAMADIVERFMKKRQEKRQKLREQNKAAGMKIWAHRGCSFRFPENTLPAFQAACEVPGITGIELDVQMSKGGQIVVFHDEKVDRLMDAEGDIRDYTLDELRRMRFKNWEPDDVYIPTLDEVLKLVKPYSDKNGIMINIELKNSNVEYEGLEEKTLALVREYEMAPYIVYSSFNPVAIKKIKQLDPEAKTGILQGDVLKCVELMAQCGADALHPHVDSVKQAETLPEGVSVRAYNGSEPFYREHRMKPIYHLQELKDRGITDFITNVPEEYL